MAVTYAVNEITYLDQNNKSHHIEGGERQTASPGGLQFNVEDGTLHIFLDHAEDESQGVDIWVPLDEAKRDLMGMLYLIEIEERQQGG